MQLKVLFMVLKQQPRQADVSITQPVREAACSHRAHTVMMSDVCIDFFFQMSFVFAHLSALNTGSVCMMFGC